MLAALAQLGIARAEERMGDKSHSHIAYDHFFALWKDADPEIPVLAQARTEYSKLQ